MMSGAERVRAGRLTAVVLAGMGVIGGVACGGGGRTPATATPGGGAAAQAVQQPLSGGPYPTIILSQAWFLKDAAGKPKPGPARLEIWRQTPAGWQTTRLEDGESNVFHKPILQSDGSILTIGAEKALLKRWRFTGGTWQQETLWQGGPWGGKFNRLRDIEIGDVDGDGKDEYVIATHDAGVVAVYNPPEGGAAAEVLELDRQPDTFVHEIEIGDIDGDGKLEFFATPSERNRVGHSQPGRVVMYRYDAAAKSYKRTVVDSFEETHAKEILVADVDGDGRQDLLSAVEAQVIDNRMVRPVEIRRYRPGPGGTFKHEVLATVDDKQCRFLVPGDFDGDGQLEIVASAIKTGLYLLDPQKKGGKTTWTVRQFEANSSGFEHAAFAADLDGDGTPELYVAADDQHELDRYVFDKAGQVVKARLGSLESSVITWNMGAGRL
jgi:hypothetical protein